MNAKQIEILLVEDNEGDVLLITEAMEDAKIRNEIHVVKNGWDAMQYLENKSPFENATIPDLIIMDINLPKLNGHEALIKIKSNDDLRHIPVIMLTTSSSDDDIYEAYRNYANCYITKPIDVRDFLKVISSIENFWISIVQHPHKPMKP